MIAAAAFALVIVVGLAGALLVSLGEDSEVGTPATTQVPPATTQAPSTGLVHRSRSMRQIRSQSRTTSSGATIEFAGNAQALVEGGAHIVDVQMYIEADFNSPGVTVNLFSIDGEITSTGITDEGDTFTPTWAWTPDGDKVVATMVRRGVSIPDTRSAVVVSV